MGLITTVSALAPQDSTVICELPSQKLKNSVEHIWEMYRIS